MMLTIHDALMNRIGFINNDVPQAMHYYSDLWHEYLAEASSTYEFTVSKSNPNYSLITSNNYISFTTDDVDYVFRIFSRKETDTEVTFSCGFINSELTETVNPFNNTAKHSLLWYLTDPNGPLKLNNNAISIGRNPFADSNNTKYDKVVTFTDQQTKLARILYLMDQWGAEIEFITNLYNDGTLQNLLLNIYDPTTDEGKIGNIRNDITLTYGKNINGVTREENGETIINAIVVTDENKKYNWDSIDFKQYNDKNQLEFYKNNTPNSIMFAPISKAMFPSTVVDPKLDQYIRHDFSIKAKSAQDLVDYGVKMMKLYAYPQVKYTVDSGAIYEMSNDGNNLERLFHSKSYGIGADQINYTTLVKPLKIGDIVMIQDTSFDPMNNGLYLQARVTERVTSWTDPSQNKYVFSNFKLMKSKIQDGLLGKMQDIVNSSAPYTLEIVTTDSLIFKNANDSATLTANLKKQGGLVSPDTYSWYQDYTDASTPFSTDQTIMIGINSLTDKPSSVFTVMASIDGVVVAQAQVSVAKVQDGGAGRAIVGSPEYKYMLSSTQTAPTDDWSSDKWTYNIPVMDATNKYLWQITHIKYSLDPQDTYSVALTAVYGDTGVAGNFMTLSPDSIVIPTDGSGTNGVYTNAYTTVTIFKGNLEDSKNWDLKVSTSAGVTGNLNGLTYFVTNLTEDSSYVDITATNKADNTITITKRLVLSKTKSGLPGKGVDHTITSYAISSSSTTMPNGDPSIPSDDWKEKVPAAFPGQYIWTATVYVYTDGTKSNPQYTIGVPGATGNKIVSTVTQYSNSEDLTIPSDWYGTIALLEKERPTKPGMYLWTRTTITYDNPSVEPSVQYLNSYWGQNGTPGTPGQDPVVVDLSKPLLIIQADAEGKIDPTNGYNNTSSVLELSQGGNRLLPVQAPQDGKYANGSYSLTTTVQSISLSTIDIDPTSMTIKIGNLQNMDSASASASVNYLATGTDYYGNNFSKNVIQIITKTLNSYGGRIFIMYAPTNDLTIEDMSDNPQYNSLYMGTAVGSSLYSPTSKAQYIWTEYATDSIVYSPTVPLNPLNGERWINNDSNSPNYNQQMVYNSTTQSWVLDMFSANNIFSNRIYSEGGDFKWIKSDNYSESNHIGTMINLETGEIELGSSSVDKDGNPITSSDTSLNRYLSWKDIGNGKKALVIGDVTSGSSLQLTPDRMSFYNGDTEVMYITNQILRINQAILLQGLYIGEHKMESRGSHTVFVFTGGV